MTTQKSDEELIKEAIDCIDDRANVYGENTPVHELIRRYKNKKNECDDLYKKRPLPGPCGDSCRLVTRSDRYCGCQD